MCNSIRLLGARLTTEITENLANYLDKIEFRSTAEIDIIAGRIFEAFDGYTHLDKVEFETKIESLANIENLDSATQISLNDQLESVDEIYQDTRLYVGIPDKNAEDGIKDDPIKSKCLRELIIERVKKTATQLLSLTSDEKATFIERFRKNKSQHQVDHDHFKKQMTSLNTKVISKSSTLTDQQQFHRWSIEMEVDQNRLQSLRNPDVDLHEDTPLMKKLIQINFCFFPNHYELLKLNPDLLDLATSTFVEAISGDSGNIDYIEFALVFPNFREIALQIVKIYYRFITVIYHWNDETKNDKEMAMSAVKSDYRAFSYLYENMRNDRDIILEVVSQCGSKIITLKSEFQNDEEIATAAVKNNPHIFQFLSDNAKSNRDLAILGIENCGENLQFVGSILQNDKEIVLKSLKNDPSAASFIGEELKGDKQIAHTAVKNRGLNLKYFSSDIKKDRAIVLTAIEENARALKYADVSLLSDTEIIYTAVKSKGELLSCANPDLYRVKSIMKAAVSSSPAAYCFASEELKSDLEIIGLILEKIKNYISYFPAASFRDVEIVNSSLRDLEVLELSYSDLMGRNKNLVLALTNLSLSFSLNKIELARVKAEALDQIKGGDLDYILENELLKGDRDVVLEVVKRDGRKLQLAGDSLKNDEEVVLNAMQSISRLHRILSANSDKISETELASIIFMSAGEDLKKDFAFGKEIVEKFGPILAFFNCNLRSCREFVLAAVKKNPSSFPFVSSEFRADREIALAAVNENSYGGNIEYVDPKLLNDKKLISLAVKHRSSLTFASSELLYDYAFMQSLENRL